MIVLILFWYLPKSFVIRFHKTSITVDKTSSINPARTVLVSDDSSVKLRRELAIVILGRFRNSLSQRFFGYRYYSCDTLLDTIFQERALLSIPIAANFHSNTIEHTFTRGFARPAQVRTFKNSSDYARRYIVDIKIAKCTHEQTDTYFCAVHGADEDLHTCI